jgi:tetratricopeptide (TPR) repeat protein
VEMWKTKIYLHPKLFMKNILIIFILFLGPLARAQKSEDIQLANEYFINGDLEKAQDLYSSLANNPKNISIIHNNYLKLLFDLEEYKEAEKYLKRISKIFPKNVYYQIDKGFLLMQLGDEIEADKLFHSIIDKNKGNQYVIRQVSQYFINKRFYEFSLKALKASRQSSKTLDQHALELANVYRFLGRKSEMIEEYLLFARQRPNNLRYIKNIFQSLLKEEKDIVNLQSILFEKIQKEPNEVMFAELLIWVNLQQKNFYGAFVQAKSLDKRFNQDGKEVIEIGRIALQNESYDNAIKIYQYVIDNSKNQNYYHLARKQVIFAREQKLKNIFPLDMIALKQLTVDYQLLIDELGHNQNTLAAFRNKALLHAFYLDEKDTAVSILNKIIITPRVSNNLKSQCKLDLGDIYLLTGEGWEATLLYSQVEKGNKDSKLGYYAKLKNARLNYFKGEFELAKSHLDILKLATTREIANDALSLSILIQNNTVFDTSDFVMKEYASIELLLFQNKKKEALTQFSRMLENYPNHSLTDEIYWKMANINLEQGNFEMALTQLNEITSKYPTDILGDDAMFLTARILEENLRNIDSAQELYNEFLLKYPGSVFTAEARKRFRKLRGDEVF